MSIMRTLSWAVVLYLLFADALMQVYAGNSGDKNWLLLASRFWLDGRVIGVDLIESNPPLIIWCFAIPVWIGRHLGQPDFHVLALIGLLFTVLSTWLGVKLISLHPAFAGNRRRQADFALLLLSVLMFFDTQVYFFDRDHITFVLIFPYVLRFMPSLARQKLPLPMQVMIGLFAALGFCIKPHCLIVLGILQLLYIVRERTLDVLWRLENLIIYAGWVLYLFCLWRFAPHYLDVVLPMAVQTYWAFSRRINNYLFLAIGFVSAGLTFVEFRPRYSSPWRREVYYFSGVCVGFLLYALVNNGWGYTWNLLLCMLLFMSGWMLWEYSWLKAEHKRQGLPFKQFTFGQIGCIANLALNSAYMLACLGTFFIWNNCTNSDECRQNDFYTIYMKQNHIRSFSTMSMDLRRWTALVRYTGARWDSRFNHLWMLPALLLDGPEPAPKRKWVLQYLGKGYAEDMNRWKPEIVFVDVSDTIFGYPHPVDLPGYFGRVPEFKEAWRHYRYLSTIDKCESVEDDSGTQGKDSRPHKTEGSDCRYALYGRIP